MALAGKSNLPDSEGQRAEGRRAEGQRAEPPVTERKPASHSPARPPAGDRDPTLLHRVAGAMRAAKSVHRVSVAVTDGCGFILFTCAVSCLLLIINGGLVSAGYQWLAELGPKFLRHARVAQATLFVVPVLLLFVQWWVIDRVLDFLRPPRRERN